MLCLDAILTLVIFYCTNESESVIAIDQYRDVLPPGEVSSGARWRPGVGSIYNLYKNMASVLMILKYTTTGKQPKELNHTYIGK